MRRGRPKVALRLDDRERKELEALARESRTGAPLSRRAGIVLACAKGLDNAIVARQLRLTPATVGKWRSRFLRRRIDGLHDEPRPGAHPTITDQQVESAIARTLSGNWTGGSRPTTEEIAKTLGLSATTLRHIWRTFGLEAYNIDAPTLSA